MGALQATFLFLILLKACECQITDAEDGEWKTATATYTKETDGSIITGSFLASFRVCQVSVFTKYSLKINYVAEGACGYGDLHKTSYGKHSA